MTIREFADKYDIPYHIVYESTYKVQTVSTMRKDREYPEKELFTEVRSLVNERLKYHRELAGKQAEILDKLRGRCP